MKATGIMARQRLLFTFVLIGLVTTITNARLDARAESTGFAAVVELFTSQSCSSCPPADALLAKLVEEGGVIALSYHVDYWNYLGWEDTLSDRAFSERQRAYARAMGRSGVYTPQAIVNGRRHLVGSNEAKLRSTVAALTRSGGGLHVPVSASSADGRLTVRIGAGSGMADVILVNFDDNNRVRIPSGENRGRTITYRHSVRDVQTIGMWDGRAADIVLPDSMLTAKGTDGCAILLQAKTEDGAPGPILGATIVEADH